MYFFSVRLYQYKYANKHLLDAYGFTQMITIQYVLGTKWGNILWGPPRLEENYLQLMRIVPNRVVMGIYIVHCCGCLVGGQYLDIYIRHCFSTNFTICRRFCGHFLWAQGPLINCFYYNPKPINNSNRNVQKC